MEATVFLETPQLSINLETFLSNDTEATLEDNTKNITEDTSVDLQLTEDQDVELICSVQAWVILNSSFMGAP